MRQLAEKMIEKDRKLCDVCGSRNTHDKVYSIQKMTRPRICGGKASVLESKETK